MWFRPEMRMPHPSGNELARANACPCANTRPTVLASSPVVGVARASSRRNAEPVFERAQAKLVCSFLAD
jgi:hypothetical protein